MKITLCGSGKFEKEFKQWNKDLSLKGHIVYGMSTYASEQGAKDWFTPDQKATLDLVHIGKIENSEAIVVLNVGGYIGDSTRKEIKYAKRIGRRIFFLEIPLPDPELGEISSQLAPGLLL